MNTIITLTLVGVLTLFSGFIQHKRWLLSVIILGLIVSIFFLLNGEKGPSHFYGHMLSIDIFEQAFGSLMIFSTILVILMSAQYFSNTVQNRESIYAIIIFSLTGAFVMIAATNLANFFVGMEIMSISLYLLAGSHKTSKASNEGAMKYFLLGSLASAFLLFGITLVYGSTGSLYYSDIAVYSAQHISNTPLIFKTGVLLIALGMGFKIGAVPFHFWVPDVYHGSPTLVTAYMITTIKIAGFAAFMSLTMHAFPGESGIWIKSITAMSVLSILLGNLSAMLQDHAKRMLAYSSISHTGYILISLVVMQADSAAVAFYYSAAYAFANLAAIAVLISIKQSRGNSTLESFKGLAKSNPVEAVSFSIAMFSLTGIPPLAGFIAKYKLFVLALQNGYLTLVIIALIGSILSIYYYFKPVINMFFKEQSGTALKTSRLSISLLVILSLLSLAWSFVPLIPM